MISFGICINVNICKITRTRVKIVAGGSGHELKSRDVVTYLMNVKEVFRDKREKYMEFLDVVMLRLE